MKIGNENYYENIKLSVKNSLSKAKIDTAFAKATAQWRMRKWLRSNLETTWSRSLLRFRACFQTAPCPSSHLNFLIPISN